MEVVENSSTNRNILNVYNVYYSESCDYQEYYADFRSEINKCLRKKGSKFGGNEVIEDEKISPTFDEIIILWCLERIDQRLPSKVTESFSSKLSDNISLLDLQTDIFRNIPFLLGATNLKVENIDTFETLKNDEKLPDFEYIEVNPAEEESEFGDTEQIELHVETFKEQTSFKCKLCELTLISKKQLNSHLKIDHANCLHKDESIKAHDLMCKICKKVFSSEISLSLHERVHNRTIVYNCIKCSLIFDTIQELDIHKNKIHLIKKPLVSSPEVLDLKDSTRQNHEIHPKPALKVESEIQINESQNFISNPNETDTSRNNVESETEINSGVIDENKIKGSASNVSNIYENNKTTENNITIKEVYKCIVCQKILSSRENLQIHLMAHFPGAEQTPLFSQLLMNMKPIQIIQASPIALPIPAEHVQVKLEAEDDIKNVAIKQKKSRSKQKDTKDEVFSCEECGKIFKNISIYRNHKIKHTGCICEECGQSFKSFKAFNYHNRMKHSMNEKTIVKCTECDKAFSNKKSLLRHKESHNLPESMEFSCDICGDLFAFEWQLKGHLARHKQAKRPRGFPCENCGRSFRSETESSRHICKHYSCDNCEMTFLRERNLKFHKRIHDGQTVYSCDECEGLFGSRKRLTAHKSVTHTDHRNWKCGECPKAFKSSSGLKQHILSHRGEKPMKCDICDAHFKTKAHLNTHAMIHNNEFPYECDKCGNKFRNKYCLKVHKESNVCETATNEEVHKD